MLSSGVNAQNVKTKKEKVKSSELYKHMQVDFDMIVNVIEETEELDFSDLVNDSTSLKTLEEKHLKTIERKMYRLDAQELAKIDKGLIVTDAEGSIYVDYQSVVSSLLSVVQAQDAYIRELGKRVEKLEGKLKTKK